MVPRTPFNGDTETPRLASPTSAKWAQSKTRYLPEPSSLFKLKRFLLCKSKMGRKSVAASDKMPCSPNKLSHVFSLAGRSQVTLPVTNLKWLHWHASEMQMQLQNQAPETTAFTSSSAGRKMTLIPKSPLIKQQRVKASSSSRIRWLPVCLSTP